MKVEHIGIIGVVAYALIGIATFGNAVVHFEREGEKDFIQCKVEAANPDYCWMRKSAGYAAIASTLAWPLYWSYRLAKRGAL